MLRETQVDKQRASKVLKELLYSLFSFCPFCSFFCYQKLEMLFERLKEREEVFYGTLSEIKVREESLERYQHTLNGLLSSPYDIHPILGESDYPVDVPCLANSVQMHIAHLLLVLLLVFVLAG